MKKVLLIILGLFIFSNISYAYTADPSVMNAIKDNQIIDYNPQTQRWSRNLGLHDYVFTKRMTIGSGGYTELVYKDKQYDINSTYEFLYYGKLIAYNGHLLKFFDLTFDGEKFVGKELTKEQVQTLFPDVTILPVSEFKDNEITIESPIFRKRAYMLWNDTERDFYKYQFEYYKKNNGFFKGIIETAFPRTFVYSHFKSRDEMFPILKINIKPVLKEPAQTDEKTPESENAGTESDAPETN